MVIPRRIYRPKGNVQPAPGGTETPHGEWHWRGWLARRKICHMDEAQPAKIAAYCYDDTDTAERTLMRAVGCLRRCGVSVGGLLQRAGERLPNGKRRFWLEDVATGASIRLDEFRGAGSMACVLDTSALAQGAVQLRLAIDARPDLIMVSRFGAVEAAGGGLLGEIGEAVCSGAMVIIPVRAAFRAALSRFLGFSPDLLADDPEAIASWATTRITSLQTGA